MILKLNNIKKAFEIPGSKTTNVVLNEISIEIQKGDSIAIIGPSGSGKSTLLNIMGTLDKPTSGTILFNNIEVSSLNDNELAKIRNKHIGFVFQLHHLLPQLNLVENVMLPTLPDKKNKSGSVRYKALELIDFVGLSEKLQQRPGQMSVGECQRAAVVRALINEPEILLADEPTGSLDRTSAEQIGDLLVKLNSDKKLTSIIVTHDEKLAFKMNKVYRLSNGSLVKI